MSAQTLQEALEASSDVTAQRAAAMLRSGEARASSPTVKYADLIEALRVRLQIKVDQVAAGNICLTTLRDALATTVAWWDANPDEQVIYDSVSTDSDVAFIFWRRAVTGALIAGFETRDATKLTLERGKEFWGPDWQPPPAGI